MSTISPIPKSYTLTIKDPNWQRVDYEETFFPVVKPTSIRTVLSLAISQHWHVHLADVKNAFLHDSLSEIVHMHQPPGFQDLRRPDHVKLLQRSLYGLKYAPPLGRHMEEIHVTWTQFEKKQDKIATLQEEDEELAYSAWRRRHKSL
ncbi:ribonuclease H-like domain-containing protein [Tanacetum coccineum]|uniref:Ribonuclease H-like domain-containing protein n=1 Tax=Tanacetum coccineum TaxID=301880 RepID=A0ABQ4ZGJ8_9ASTR